MRLGVFLGLNAAVTRTSDVLGTFRRITVGFAVEPVAFRDDHSTFSIAFNPRWPLARITVHRAMTIVLLLHQDPIKIVLYYRWTIVPV